MSEPNSRAWGIRLCLRRASACCISEGAGPPIDVMTTLASLPIGVLRLIQRTISTGLRAYYWLSHHEHCGRSITHVSSLHFLIHFLSPKVAYRRKGAWLHCRMRFSSTHWIRRCYADVAIPFSKLSNMGCSWGYQPPFIPSCYAQWCCNVATNPMEVLELMPSDPWVQTPTSYQPSCFYSQPLQLESK